MGDESLNKPKNLHLRPRRTFRSDNVRHPGLGRRVSGRRRSQPGPYPPDVLSTRVENDRGYFLTQGGPIPSTGTKFASSIGNGHSDPNTNTILSSFNVGNWYYISGSYSIGAGNVTWTNYVADLTAGETGLSNDPATWSVFDGNGDIAATSPENTLTISRPADPRRFFVIEEFTPPPVVVFSENFDAAAALPADWITGANAGDTGTTIWEVGTPSVVGPSAAESAPNCAATNLAGDYGLHTDIFLRTPAIDLITAVGATLNFDHYVDIETGFDFGTIRLLDAGNADAELAILEMSIDGMDSTDWGAFRKALPAAALGKTVKIEFGFEADEVEAFAGWYIENVEVTVP